MDSAKHLSRETVLKMYRAAILTAMGLKRGEVAREMASSSPTVGRLIREAKRQGILVARPPLLRVERMDHPAWGAICCPHLVQAAERLLAPHGVRQVRVVPAAEGDPEATRARLAMAAALILNGVLEQAAQARVPLGFTSGAMVRQAIEAAEPPAIDMGGVELVALSGDPSILPGEEGYERAIRASANRTVIALGERLGLPGDRIWRFSLPVEWPPALMREAEQLALVGAIAEQERVVSAILGPRNGVGDGVRAKGLAVNGGRSPLIELMATVFAEVQPRVEGGVGDPDWVAGRTNGHLLPTRASAAAGERQCALRNRLAPGASPGDLRRVAERARPHYIHGRGVVLLGLGPGSVDGILALTAAQAVNELVVSSDCAQALLEAVGWRPRKAR